MKITVSKPIEIEVTAIRCELPVEHGEEDMPHDFPFRKGNTWSITIDIETGKIHNWPASREPFRLEMKVTDGGVYTLLSGPQVVAVRDGYVPDCIPGDYGDYVDFDIVDGTIINWAKGDKSQIAKDFFVCVSQ
jgi:hypothetical protein